MVRSRNKILLIVEGKKTEPNLIKQIGTVKWNDGAELSIVDIRTNIYCLYQEIKKLNCGYEFDTTSTIEVLKQILKKNNREEDIEKLCGKYSDIYLFFDLEIQDNHYMDKKGILTEMLDYFCNETENGLLLINYPMIEAYRDYKEPLIDDNYKNLFVSVEDVFAGKYKQLVHERGSTKNFSKYSIHDFELLFLQNLIKANFILSQSEYTPSYDSFKNIVNGKNKILYK